MSVGKCSEVEGGNVEQTIVSIVEGHQIDIRSYSVQSQAMNIIVVNHSSVPIQVSDSYPSWQGGIKMSPHSNMLVVSLLSYSCPVIVRTIWVHREVQILTFEPSVHSVENCLSSIVVGHSGVVAVVEQSHHAAMLDPDFCEPSSIVV